MNKIQIGSSNLHVAPINLGGNVFGWTLNEKESFDILDAFVDRGFNFIDTADVYSVWAPDNVGGESERIIGKWIKERKNREDVVIATKVGWDFGDGRKGLSANYIEKAVEDSLKRLQTDVIDLYYTHKDEGEIPVEETLEAYGKLIKAGKVRYVAASNVPTDRLKKSLELGKTGDYPLYQALQPHYNLVERATYEKEYAPIAKEYNLTVFPYWALAAGFLTGKYRSEDDLSKSVRGEGNRKYLNEKGLAVIEALDRVAAKHQSTNATIALAWLLAQPQIGAPIASATSEKQLKTIFDAPTIRLDAEDLAKLDQASK